MRIEFNKAVWQNWMKQGMQYLLTEELEEQDSNPELAEFVVYAGKNETDAKELLLHKLRGVPFELQYKIVCYEINSDSAREIAEGIFGCRFYTEELPSQQSQHAEPHSGRSLLF